MFVTNVGFKSVELRVSDDECKILGLAVEVALLAALGSEAVGSNPRGVLAELIEPMERFRLLESMGSLLNVSGEAAGLREWVIGDEVSLKVR